MIAADGEEELGSPHYHQVVAQYEDRLRSADGALFPFNSQRPDGAISVILGVKGILYVEMTATGGAWGGPAEAEIHGSYKAIVDALTTNETYFFREPRHYDFVRETDAPFLADRSIDVTGPVDLDHQSLGRVRDEQMPIGEEPYVVRIANR